MRLRHLHLSGLTSYAHAQKLQDRLARAILDYKKLSASGSGATIPSDNSSGANRNQSLHSLPEPMIITAEFYPVYTCGRREIGTVSEEQIDHLRAPVDISGVEKKSLGPRDKKEETARAEFHTSLRGGQTTYHGPGQLVAYPILDLKQHINPTYLPSSTLHGITARTYVHSILEEVVRRTCARYGVDAFRTENPGLWTERTRKICAVGVHLRRGVASHGVAVNVGGEVKPWFDRIVACGLEGVSVDWLGRNRRDEVIVTKVDSEADRGSKSRIGIREVGDVFVEEFADLIGTAREVVSVGENDV